jgi:hypothetical protein
MGEVRKDTLASNALPSDNDFRTGCIMPEKIRGWKKNKPRGRIVQWTEMGSECSSAELRKEMFFVLAFCVSASIHIELSVI